MKKEKFYKKKSLGQNFLINAGIPSHIVQAAQIKVGDVVLEIGPGKGVLTKKLLGAGATVVAVEKDDRLIPMLKVIFEKEVNNKRLTLIRGDILNLDIEKTIMDTPYKVVANIPYYITGELIRLLLSSKHQPKSMVLMLQKEVAKRIVAKDRKESVLSLSVKAYGAPKYIKTVSRGSFSPAPNVDSAILAIENINKDFFDKFSEKSFFEIVRAGFSSKRKKLIRNLEKVLPKKNVEDVFDQISLSRNIRAENLALNEWGELSKLRNPQ